MNNDNSLNLLKLIREKRILNFKCYLKSNNYGVDYANTVVIIYPELLSLEQGDLIYLINPKNKRPVYLYFCGEGWVIGDGINEDDAKSGTELLREFGRYVQCWDLVQDNGERMDKYIKRLSNVYAGENECFFTEDYIKLYTKLDFEDKIILNNYRKEKLYDLIKCSTSF